MSAPALPSELSAPAREYAGGPHHHLIAGARREAADGRTFTTVDPSTGLSIAEVAHGGPEDVDRAVGAARSALEGAWGALTASKRASLIYRLADLVEGHAGELAELESLDNGKPVGLARIVDVRLSVDYLRYFAGWPTKITGQTIPVGMPGMHVYTRREPVGVCGQIVPDSKAATLAVSKPSKTASRSA